MSHITTSYRRPVLFLASACLLFVLVIAWRATSAWLNPPAAPRPPQPIESSDADLVWQMQARLQRNPNDVDAYAGLGLALLQQVRLTADPALYQRAATAFDEALRRDPQQIDALFGQGVLALALHDFASALDWAERARAINPFRAEIVGVMVDALVELGRYEDAVERAQTMVNMRPDANSYSRVSYLRELHGDRQGAIGAMQLAAQMSPVGSESWVWFTTHVGHLFFEQGETVLARQQYERVLVLRSNDPFAQAGLARVTAASGQRSDAIARYMQLTERLPLPEFLVSLGDLYTLNGDTVNARRQYEMVRVVQKLNTATGMDVDLELALFEADHGDPQQALVMARSAYSRRPTIFAADALAWALYKNDLLDEAASYSRQALRLGTRNALFHYHAGMIALAAGEHASARQHLQTALSINPHFSLLAPQADHALAD